ncbi:26S proteasome regulatory subunit N3 [Nematocida ausubeli]|uniref:PCI domain-containing protein n=1 Tax=Nematocida ausubeli (strain ATCC PRA-371 / ERTm2) TaxID=1913371 RepID=H8ZCZ7_NEMA1|nr:uncharacterized protein NESG_01986 [Nematocida ausubeli]EHY65537.1 hypothetical protein NERG_01144 [Nematocida ausubeli]KAI5137777.1 26S proteasome regulatory subunit N3 [Nematocida ausubeli]KAI5150576.1 26S proteasome regulatory subunit N3 [Nematocida ausubeli]KAI5164261.1 26S proteasome regulatory subunit N3 [Nematocida ausubeli]KFG25217.1 hypothetical protein NESG_01986 [Nematocida ausubeli]
MEKVQETIEQINRATLKTTKDALRPLYDIISSVSTEELISELDAHSSGPSRYLLLLFVSMSYIYKEEYEQALDTSMNSIAEITKESSRILDSVLAGLWTAARISSTHLRRDILSEYLLGLAAAREYQNVETITVIINNILMDLQKKQLYDEAHTFLTGISLPDEADVGQSSVFYYLASIVYLMAEDYSASEQAINKAIVKSTDSVFTDECRKAYVVACLHQGKHPSRDFFVENPKLKAYLQILLAIKSCSLEKFHEAVAEEEQTLRRDGLYHAVLRLETAVQKEQVRRIGVVYTKILLSSVGEMLGVSEESAAFLLQNSIEEGAIAGYIDTDMKEYVGMERRDERNNTLKIEDMLSVANSLAMIKKHEPVKKKTLEELQADMTYNEYRI